MFSVFGHKVLLAPAEAFNRRVELFFGWRNHALPIQLDQGFWPSMRASRAGPTRQTAPRCLNDNQRFTVQ